MTSQLRVDRISPANTSEIIIDGFSGGMPTVTLIESSGTWTNNGAKKIKVEVIGAGGGGGGGRSRSDAQYAFGANGGGAGGYSMKVIDVSSISSATVVVGSKGLGGGTDENASNGGQSSWNDGVNNLISEGGVGGSRTGHNESTLGGTASGGDINISGGSGQCGFNYSGMNGGIGGLATKSYGSPGVTDYFGQLVPETRDAIGYGHGGGGACSNSNNKTGGVGADGLIIITEY